MYTVADPSRARKISSSYSYFREVKLPHADETMASSSRPHAIRTTE